MKKWCVYRERSHYEARLKLKEMYLNSEECEFIIAELISSNFLSETRYCDAFVRGKIRMNHWGKRKIEAVLRSQGIPSGCINDALNSFDETEYERVIEKLIDKRLKTLKGKASENLYFETLNYLYAKGFETDRVSELLKEKIKQLIQ